MEPAKWPLPNIAAMGQPSTGPCYMARNREGKGVATLLCTTEESNKERARVAVRNTE